MDVDSGAVRRLTRFPAWHAAPDDAGDASSATRLFPIAGCTFRVLGARGSRRREAACAAASSEGAHWGGPFPYNDGPLAVDAPQHTHPHPRFSPDGSRVLYTSDASGHAQLYEVLLEEETR